MSEAIVKKRVDGKVAIITGGASGMGEASARLFAEHGATVVIVDIQDKLGQVVADSIGLDRCTYVHCDVTNEEQIKQLVEQTVQTHGRIDIVFCNAGVIFNNQTILDLDLSKMDRLFAVNVRGPAALIKHGGRAMVAGGIKGSIICTASVSACSSGAPATVDYTMSKHAVLGLVRAACAELGKHGIRANCISPHAVATPLLCGILGMEQQEAEKAFEGSTWLQGMVLKAENVADAALFLASDESAFISGHNLTVDGGFLNR